MTIGENASFTALRGITVLLIALVSWLVIGPLAAIVFMNAAGLSNTDSALASYMAIHIPYLVLFAALMLSSRLILHMNLRTLLGAADGFRWCFAAESGLLYLAVMAAAVPFVSGGISRGAALSGIMPFMLPVLFLTPVQAVSEEIIFRALPARTAYGNTLPDTFLSALPPVILSGIVFAFPHMWNQEVVTASSALLPALCYFSWGALAMLLAIATGGFEAPAAMHAANNLFIALIVNYRGSSMPTSSFLIADKAGSAATLAETAAAFAIIYLLARRKGCCRAGFGIKKHD